MGFPAHLDALAHGGVARLADTSQMGHDLRDVGGVVADALHVRHYFHGCGDKAQVAGHRLLAEQQGHAAVLDVPFHPVDLRVALDDLLCPLGVSRAEGLQRVLHRVGGQLAHLGQQSLQGREVGVVLCACAHIANPPF